MSSNKTTESGGIDIPVERKPTVIVVAGLDRDTTESGVAVALEVFGPLLAIDLDRDSKGRSRGMGTVTFECHEDAMKAIDSSESLRIDNRSPRLRLRTPSVSAPQDLHDGWTEIRRRKIMPRNGND